MVLPGYTSFFGLTDDWARLFEALKATRALGREKFSVAEWELLNDLISAAEKALRGARRAGDGQARVIDIADLISPQVASSQN